MKEARLYDSIYLSWAKLICSVRMKIFPLDEALTLGQQCGFWDAYEFNFLICVLAPGCAVLILFAIPVEEYMFLFGVDLRPGESGTGF